LQRWAQISISGTAAATILNRHLPDTEAFLLRAVVIRCALVSCRSPSGAESLDQRIGKSRHLRRQRAVTAAIKAGAALPRFLAAEIREYVGIRPAREPV
jgi:hypothetical protein